MIFNFKANSMRDTQIYLKKTLNKKFDETKHMIYIISNIMKTTKGRDKICGFIQYLTKILYLSSFYTNLPQYKYLNLHENKFNKMFYKIFKSMKEGRKIFRFLKFIDIYVNIIKLKKGKTHLLIMKFISEISSFFYYILDNFLWGFNLGIFDNIINLKITEKTKFYKTWASFIRVLIVIYIKVLNYFKSCNDVMINTKKYLSNNFDTKNNLKILINSRNKKRKITVELFQNYIRFIMLYYNLTLPFHQIIHPVFIPFCGLISNIISIIRYCSDMERIELLKVDDNPVIDFKNKSEFIKSVSTIFTKQRKNNIE